MGRKFHTVSMAKSMKGDLAGWKWGVRCRRGCMTPQRQGCSDVVLQGLVIRDPQSGGLCLLRPCPRDTAFFLLPDLQGNYGLGLHAGVELARTRSCSHHDVQTRLQTQACLGISALTLSMVSLSPYHITILSSASIDYVPPVCRPHAKCLELFLSEH